MGGFAKRERESNGVDDKRLAVDSQGDLLGTNADLNQELCFFGLLDDPLTPITKAGCFGRCNLNPVFAGDGSM